MEQLLYKASPFIDGLEKIYPNAVCSLVAKEPWQLLLAVCLSAQCTDARVNLVTQVLFDTFPTIDSLANAPIEQIEEIVKPCGLFKVKSRNLKDTCIRLAKVFNYSVPDNMEDLLSLPGVGRKTANLILGDVYGVPGSVVCDTHCIRITNRFGLITTNDPYKAEMALKKVIDPEKASDFCHRLVLFGRDTCTAKILIAQNVHFRIFALPLIRIIVKRDAKSHVDFFASPFSFFFFIVFFRLIQMVFIR